MILLKVSTQNLIQADKSYCLNIKARMDIEYTPLFLPTLKIVQLVQHVLFLHSVVLPCLDYLVQSRRSQ